MPRDRPLERGVARRKQGSRNGAEAFVKPDGGGRGKVGAWALVGTAPGYPFWPKALFFMWGLGEAADQPSRFALNLALNVGERCFATFAPSLPLEQENGQRPKEGEITRCGGLLHGAAVLILGTERPIFDRVPFFRCASTSPVQVACARP